MPVCQNELSTHRRVLAPSQSNEIGLDWLLGIARLGHDGELVRAVSRPTRTGLPAYSDERREAVAPDAPGSRTTLPPGGSHQALAVFASEIYTRLPTLNPYLTGQRSAVAAIYRRPALGLGPLLDGEIPQQFLGDGETGSMPAVLPTIIHDVELEPEIDRDRIG